MNRFEKWFTETSIVNVLVVSIFAGALLALVLFSIFE